jgi:hypothetical protein
MLVDAPCEEAQLGAIEGSVIVDPTPDLRIDRYRGDRFSCSMPAPATSSRHLYTGHRQGSTQATPWLRAHQPGAPCPGNSALSRF